MGQRGGCPVCLCSQDRVRDRALDSRNCTSREEVQGEGGREQEMARCVGEGPVQGDDQVQGGDQVCGGVTGAWR